MNCLEFRQRKLAEPQADDPALADHERQCNHCRAFGVSLDSLDDRIRQAFEVPVPERLEDRILLKHSFTSGSRRRRGWGLTAIAASIVTAVMIATAVLRPTPVTGLEYELAAHLGKEEMMAATQQAFLTPASVRAVLARAGIGAETDLTRVIHAANCIIEGRLVAHLIIRDRGQDTTVLLTPFDIDGESTFSAAGWHGRMAPTGFGAIAVFTPSDGDSGVRDATLQRLRRQLASSPAETLALR